MKIYSPDLIGTTTATGSVIATLGFTGSLQGTASFATTASFALNSVSPFPFTGSARITGSLIVTGSVTIRSGSLVAGDGGQSNTSTDVNNGNIVLGGAGGTNQITKGYGAVLIGGYNGYITPTNAGMFGQTVIGGSGLGITTGALSNNTIVGGYYTTITSGEMGASFGARDSVISAAGFFPKVILGGQNNIISSGDTHATIVGGSTNTLSGGSNTSIIASNNATISSVGSYGVIMGCRTATLAGGDTMFIIGGQGHNVGSGYGDAYLGGRENGASGRSTGGLGHNVSVGGYANILGGASTSISALLGGNTNKMGTSAISVSQSAIVAGANNIMLANNSVILGGNNITASADNTVYVPNIVVSGSSTYLQPTVFSGSLRGEVNALTITSTTASLNCALDNFFTITLAASINTFINPTNILPGQTINVRIKQPAATGGGTVSFPSSVKQISGSSYVPTSAVNAEDIITLVSFDSSSLYLANVKNFI